MKAMFVRSARRVYSVLQAVVWFMWFLATAPDGSAFVAVIQMPRLYTRISRNVLTGSSLKAVGMIIALAVISILGGLSYFNATQQKGINNAVSIVISMMGAILIVLFLSLLRGRR